MMASITLEGKEMTVKEVKPYGNGAYITLPKEWIGEKVVVIRPTRKQ